MPRSQHTSVSFPQFHGSINQLNYLNELELGVLLFITKDLFAALARMHVLMTSLWQSKGASYEKAGVNIEL